VAWERPPWLVCGVTKAAMLVVVVLAGCGGAAAEKRAPAEAALDVGDAAKAARGVLTEIYGDLRRGDVGGVQGLIAPDVFAVGPGASDVYLAREDAVVAVAAVMRTGDRHKVVSRALKVSATPGGHSAWASDSLEVDGVPLALTAVLVESDGLWSVVAVHVGHTGEGPAGVQKRAALPGGVAAGAAEAVKLYRAGIAAPERFVEQLASGPDVLVMGPGAREVARGVKPIKKLWKKRLAAPPKLSLDGEPHAQVTPDGALAWVFANLDVAAAGGAKEPYRSLVLYEREGDAKGANAKPWKLVSMHDSIATGK
jgi:hypothetical protein